VAQGELPPMILPSAPGAAASYATRGRTAGNRGAGMDSGDGPARGASLAARIGDRFETAFCFLALSTFLGAYTSIPLRLLGTDLKGGESNPFNAVPMALVLAVTVVLTAVNWRRFLAVARFGGPVNLFVAIAVVSSLWSFHPAVSLRKAVTLLQIVLFAYYLAAKFPVERVLRLLTSVFAVALVLSAIVAVAVPEVGTMHEPELAGAWRGVFAHKSALGGACIMGTLCFAWRWTREPERRVLHSAGILLCLALAVLSMSKTAQLTIALLGPIAVFLHLLRLPGLAKLWAAYVMAALFAVLGGGLFFFFAEITEAVGKDPTLTGRVPVWRSLAEFALHRPLGGYGYNAFFVLENPDVEQVWRLGGWNMWDAHNTVLGIFLELGLPGLVLSQWVLLATVWRALRAFSGDAVPWAGFAAGYAISYVVMSLVEMVMFRGDLYSTLITFLYVALRRQAEEARAAEAWAASFRVGAPWLGNAPRGRPGRWPPDTAGHWPSRRAGAWRDSGPGVESMHGSAHSPRLADIPPRHPVRPFLR
jgi:exopolysaccharide production protein ExoQ